VESALRNEFLISRRRRMMLAASIAVVISFAITPLPASAESLFDFFFGGNKQQRQEAPAQASFFDDPTNGAQQPQPPVPPRPVAGGSGPAFCVRSCDGKYFPLMRAAASPVQMCQAFCPASATKVFYGSNIDYAASVTGERYADSENAFAYRKALRADCTCNGKNSAGLAPVDLALDNSLRAGDVIATTDGLVAYSGVRADGQAGDFKPIASYPGLTAAVRARLGEMKVAPVTAEVANDAAAPATVGAVPLPPVPKAALAKNKRAEAN
jgi:hypothetical protein